MLAPGILTVQLQCETVSPSFLSEWGSLLALTSSNFVLSSAFWTSCMGVKTQQRKLVPMVSSRAELGSVLGRSGFALRAAQAWALILRTDWSVCGGGGCGLVAYACLTLCDPMDCSSPDFSVRGISQTRILEWVAISLFRESSWPSRKLRSETHRLCISDDVCIQVSSVVSDSLWQYWLWLTRLLCPWNSADKNTGVGCHAFLQGIFLTQGWNLSLLHLLLQVDSLPTGFKSSPTAWLLCDLWYMVLLLWPCMVAARIKRNVAMKLLLWNTEHWMNDIIILHLSASLFSIWLLLILGLWKHWLYCIIDLKHFCLTLCVFIFFLGTNTSS